MAQITTKLGDGLVRVAADPDEVESALERHRITVERLRELAADSPGDESAQADLGRSLGRLAELAKLAEAWDEARTAREESVQIWRTLGRDKACVLGELQSALYLHLEGDEHAAHARFDMLEGMMQLPDFAMYRDFYWEYRGTAFAREGAADRAINCFEKALQLRLERGNARQIEETEILLTRVRSEASESD